MVQARKIHEWRNHAQGVYALANGRFPNTILSGSGDRFVAEWNMESLLPEAFSVKMEQSVYAVKCIVEKQMLTVGTSAGNLHVIDLSAKTELKNLELHEKGIFDLVYLRDAELLISFGGDGLMAVWDINSWELKLQFLLGDGKLRRGRLNKDESLLAVACGDGSIRIFETAFFNELYTFEAHESGVNSLAWHPTKPLLISGGKDAHLRFWNTDDGFAEVRSIPAHNFAIYDIVFSPDAQFCATASRDKTIKIWDASSFDKPLRIDRKTHASHSHSVNALLWSDFDGRLYSAGDDRSIMVWELS